ncbi:MAG: peptidoglycan bridge formation glycyltransferase FemA/FemB family protein [Candidatus Omnitrophica bacterium]|nr:peptidoglycan bridge formation glycyltransferase FemA/FemB family protein [Candidatus Omnitrophota bacterium]
MKFEVFDANSIDRKTWNERVASVPEGSVFQTTFWADLLQDYLLYRPLYFVLKDDTGVQGECLAFIRGIVHQGLFERPLLHLMIPAVQKAFPQLHWQEGPLVFGKDLEKKAQCLKFFMQSVIEFAKKNKIKSIGNATFPQIADYNSLVKEEDLNLWVRKKWATFIIDLEEEEKILWERLKPSTRNKIRNANKTNISVKRLENENELKQYQSFREASGKELKRRVSSYDNLLYMWRHLKLNNCCDFFAAFFEGSIIASLGLWYFNKNMYEWGVYNSRYASANRLHASDILKWKVIEFGKNSDFNYYNLAGVNPQPPDNKEKGIYEFKQKWGGQFKEYWMYDWRG